MFSIKKKGREVSERFHKGIKKQITPFLANIGERCRLRPRIRWLNIWAKKHPKKLMSLYLIFAISLLISTIAFDCIIERNETEDTLGLKTMPSMIHRLQSLNNSEIMKEAIRQEVNELGQKGMEIYHELDSLMKLPVKTHTDSVKIVQYYNILNNTFNSKDNDP